MRADKAALVVARDATRFGTMRSAVVAEALASGVVVSTRWAATCRATYARAKDAAPPGPDATVVRAALRPARRGHGYDE